MIVACILFLVSVAGIAASAILLKGKKRLRIACIVLRAAAACIFGFYILLTLYFGWAVANQDADEWPDEVLVHSEGKANASLRIGSLPDDAGYFSLIIAKE